MNDDVKRRVGDGGVQTEGKANNNTVQIQHTLHATKNEKATLVGVTTLGWLKKAGCMRNGPPVLYLWYCGPRGVSHMSIGPNHWAF